MKLLHLGICLVSHLSTVYIACLHASLFVNVICITWHDYYSQCHCMNFFIPSSIEQKISHFFYFLTHDIQLANSQLHKLIKTKNQQKTEEKFAKYFTSINKINSSCQQHSESIFLSFIQMHRTVDTEETFRRSLFIRSLNFLFFHLFRSSHIFFNKNFSRKIHGFGKRND